MSISPRGSMPGVVIGNKIVFFGGWFQFSFSLDYGGVYEYNTDTGTSVETYPEGNSPVFGYESACAYVPSEGNIYSFGGNDGNNCGSVSQQFSVYDYSGNKTVTPVNVVGPDFRMKHSMTYVQSRNSIIMYGGSLALYGCSEDTPMSEMWEFNLTSRTWTRILKPGAPFVAMHRTVLYGDALYVYGGGNDGSQNGGIEYTSNIYKFDLMSLSWSLLAPSGGIKPPVRCCGATAVTSDGFIIVHGGSFANETDDLTYNDIWAYDIQQNEWLNCTVDFPIKRTRHPGGLVSDREFVFVGGVSLSGGDVNFHQDAQKFFMNITRIPKPVTTASSSQSGPAARVNTVAIAVGVAVPLVVIFIALVLVAAVMVMKRKQRKQLIEMMKYDNTTQPSQIPTVNRASSIGSNLSEPAEFAIKFNFIPGDSITLGPLLGSGNFGAVYKGSWEGTDVALKKIENAQELDDEMKILGKLNHPNILRLLGVTNKSGDIFMVTEFVRKGSLDKFLKENPSLTPIKLMQMAIQVASGMRYLETNNVIHGDLALRNLLITVEDNHYVVKVSDFGLSRHHGDQKKQNQTPIRWSPPEVLRQQAWTSKSDIWSFGVVLWELFSYGTQPYEGMNLTQVAEQVLGGFRLPTPETCPARLYKYILTMWQEDPNRRPTFGDIYNTLVDIMKNDLGEYASSSPQNDINISIIPAHTIQETGTQYSPVNRSQQQQYDNMHN